MHKLADDERQLLRYYGERERVISGPQRGPAHQLLSDLGYIKEQRVNLQESLIVWSLQTTENPRKTFLVTKKGQPFGLTDNSP